MEKDFNKRAKKFIGTKQRNLTNLNNIVGKVKTIHIPITDTEDNLAQKYTTHGECFVQTWANNDSVRPSPKRKLLIVLEFKSDS